jgi:hypothetical protein
MKIADLLRVGSMIRCRGSGLFFVYWREKSGARHIQHRNQIVAQGEVAVVCSVQNRESGYARHRLYHCTLLVDGKIVEASAVHALWKGYWEVVE